MREGPDRGGLLPVGFSLPPLRSPCVEVPARVDKVRNLDW